MQIQPTHPNFIMPTYGSEEAGAFDIYMPEAGTINGTKKMFGLGFKAAVPKGYVAMLCPRSGTGAKFSVELNNTVGIIDSDYRGEWMAALRTKDGLEYSWAAGDRVIQCLIVPVARVHLHQVQELSETVRGAGGFGASGK